MNKERPFFDAILGPNVAVPLDLFLVNLVLAALLAGGLSWTYQRFGHSLSNRKAFARNFLLVTLATMLVITIVKSSLALSLGLVGALSIVRFRAAIKEPEELSYLFLAIGIGLGLGAGQPLVTLAGFAAVILFLWLRHRRGPGPAQPNLFLTISSHGPPKVALSQILDILRQGGGQPVLKRFDESAEALEVSAAVAFTSASQLEECSRRLQTLSGSIRVSCIEDRGLGV